MPVETIPLENGFGAEVRGVDCSRALAAAERQVVDALLLDHHVLAFRGQRLTPSQTVAFSRAFGELEPHVLSQYHHPDTDLILVLSNRVDDSGRPLGLRDAGSFWHSDVSFKPRPARFTLLYAIEVPAQGGDTLFCDMVAAYDALPATVKQCLRGLAAVHDYSARDRLVDKTGTAPQLSAAQRRRTPPVRHPVVRRHPGSGREVLYVNPTYTTAIVGLDEAASRRTLDEIFAHCLRPRFCMRYRWRPGDVLIWDNAAVMHAATTQSLESTRHRTLWRTVILGEPPLGVDAASPTAGG